MAIKVRFVLYHRMMISNTYSPDLDRLRTVARSVSRSQIAFANLFQRAAVLHTPSGARFMVAP
jgi:hypothetical protein